MKPAVENDEWDNKDTGTKSPPPPPAAVRSGTCSVSCSQQLRLFRFGKGAMRAARIEPAPSRHETGDSTTNMAPTKGPHKHTHTGTGMPQGNYHITPTGMQGVQVQIPIPRGEVDEHIPDMFALQVRGD